MNEHHLGELINMTFDDVKELCFSLGDRIVKLYVKRLDEVLRSLKIKQNDSEHYLVNVYKGLITF